MNSGVIGTLQGQTVAILPNSYGDVYGTGIDLRGGAGYALNDLTEVRGMFIWQSADADLVRMGDLGPSALYGQYSDYMSFALDLGIRRYAPLASKDFRLYGEATIGLGWINRIDLQLAAPQSNAIVNATDLYDRTAAFTFGVNVGVLVPIAEKVDFNAQLGLLMASGDLPEEFRPWIERVQNDLFDVGADLAVPPESERERLRIAESQTAWICRDWRSG